MSPQNISSSEIIDALGGTTKVAELCEVSVSAVSQWRTDGIPKARLMFLRLARANAFREGKTQKNKSEAADA